VGRVTLQKIAPQPSSDSSELSSSREINPEMREKNAVAMLRKREFPE
jgi:hypothetical protein